MEALFIFIILIIFLAIFIKCYCTHASFTSGFQKL